MVGRGITPLGRRRQHELFARAVESRPESVDPELAAELAVVDVLRRAAASSGPDAAARERMRRRILDADRPTAAVAIPAPRRSSARGRLAVAAAAALCLVLSLAGMSLLLSRDALPGDALYGMKRTAESASLGFTFGDESKALKRLEFAAARIVELETLADKYADDGPLGAYLTALADFDADAAAGSRELSLVGANSDERVLGTLDEWARAQASRLTELRSRLPSPAVTRSVGSLDLLDRVSRRTAELRARTGCSPVTSGIVDEVGPLPADSPCSSGTPVPGAPSSPTPSILVNAPAVTATSVPLPSAAPPSAAGTSAPDVSVLTSPVASSPPSTSVVPAPSLGLPTITIPLPLPLPGLPGIAFGS